MRMNLPTLLNLCIHLSLQNRQLEMQYKDLPRGEYSRDFHGQSGLAPISFVMRLDLASAQHSVSTSNTVSEPRP